ncbi:MAG: indolepyruvate ferredoxin oxidoreductase family protein [Burkholderiaceae bacterium]|nr:indolepyruvate ferredoxin oxidoreductase family protein [Burkholderiaceae bacterium]
MNMPTDPGLREVSLDDKYDATEGRVYITGTQALVRLPLMQRERDVAAGLNTAGYISGYRGSPVGGYDQALWKARKQLESHHIRFVPGLNEDLAATAIWGTQQVNSFPGAKYDGIFSIWYGKGPGVDRSGDAFRHANQAGTSRHGGVLAVGGDDHGAKSSTVAAQTDFIFSAVSIPVLAPATIQDYIDLGLHGFALSRFSGLWVGMKAVTDTIETAGIVDVSASRIVPVLPTLADLPPEGLNLRLPEDPFLKLEERLARYKLPAALAYARSNRLDANVFGRDDQGEGGGPCQLAIVSTGKSWLDVMQALADLGIDDASARRIGLKVFKVAMPWPLEPQGIREFCAGAAEVLVIEEKRSLIEAQIKEHLYDMAERPRVVGKRDEQGAPCVPDFGELSPVLCARLIASRLRLLADGRRSEEQRGVYSDDVRARVDARLAILEAKERGAARHFEIIERIPYFCSGCPHNSSTKVPEGSRAGAGIGCHYMAQWMDRSTSTFTQMGGEGMNWVGQAPFTQTPHIFQNLGDGTYNHSGALAIRHAVATGTRMTYKILFNDAVAMTGGQTHDSQLTPGAIARQVRAEGVRKVVVVTDEPQKYPAGYFERDIAVHHRSELDAVQRQLREEEGVTVLIYDQTCAAEKRRRRKRGAFPDPDRRAFINESVCEGCGDCGVQSNCVSIEPVETEFGRKRAINQSSCNKDFSCVNGFCPSFVTVEGGRVRRGKGAEVAQDAAAIGLPDVTLPAIDDAYSLLVTGIGGTGVVTIGQILGMAAHLEGKGVTVLDMAGLAQKNGAVMSFVRFARSPDRLFAPRIGTASADAVLGCDIVVTASKDALARMAPGRTRLVANVASTPTADFTRNADWKFPLGSMEGAIAAATGPDAASFVDATRLANGLMGDAIAANMFMLGYAFQKGLIPVSARSIDRAIELNEVAVESNRRAFSWGRRAAADLAQVEAVAAPPASLPVNRKRSESLDELIARRVDFLTDYQDEAWARRYLALVEKVRDGERALGAAPLPAPEPGEVRRVVRSESVSAIGQWPLTEAVASYFFKLMSYKDEYEVARLYTRPEFSARLREQFEGDVRLQFHLAPPLLAKRKPNGELIKQAYGPWLLPVFRVLARLRRLRGTAFDLFGRTEERRGERALIDEYERTIGALLAQLTAERRSLAVELASVPEQIRGFGHVKARHLAAARTLREQLLARYQAETPSVGRSAELTSAVGD